MSENEKNFRCPTQAPMEAYSFEWVIEDFRSICAAKTRAAQCLFSENITTGESSLKTQWCLLLDFRYGDTIGVYLNRISNMSLRHYVIYDFHIVSSDKKKYFAAQVANYLPDDSSNSFTDQEEGNLSDDSSNSFTEQEEGNLSGDSSNSFTEQGKGYWYRSHNDCYGHYIFIARKKLLDKEQVLLLPNGTLTIVCEFQVSVTDASAVTKLTQELSEVKNYTTTMSENVKKYRCHTLALKEAYHFEWSIENFSTICSAKTKVKGDLFSEKFTTNKSSLEAKWWYKLKFTNNDAIGEVCLTRFSKKSLHHYVIFSLSIVGSDKKKYFTKQAEGCLYGNSFQGWDIENFINRKKLFEEEQLLLPNDTLTIVCELQVSVIDASIVSKLTQESNTIHSSTSDFENPDLLMDDLQHLYTSQMFSDFTLKVGDEELKVHKKVLCKSSSVFRTLLNCDMKENLTNCLEITDFDPSIVKAMVHYIYCNQAQDFLPELSVQLFSIADKYNLQDLKDICVQYILENINIDNVCDVLTLGELHDEPQLKTAARDFICANAVDIQETEKWVSLSKTMPHLMLDIMSRLVISQMKNTNTQRGININTTISNNSLYCVLVLVISILYFLILY